MDETYSRKAVRNTVYIFLNWFSRNVLGILFWIILGKFLLPAELGIFSSILNFAIFIATFALLGLPQAIIKLTSEYIGRKDYKKIKALNSYVFKIIFYSIFVFSFTIVIFGNFISKVVNLTYSQLLLSIPVIISICFLYILWAIVYGIGKVKELAIGNILYGGAKVIICIVLIFLGTNYVGLIGAVVFSALIAIGYMMYFIKFGKGNIQKRKIWIFASSSLIGAVTGALYNQGGVLLTKIFSTSSAAGIFTLAFMISMPLRSIPASLARAIFPLESEAWSKKRKETVRNLISRVLKYSYMFCIPALLVFLVFSREIILLISSREYLSGIEAIRFLVLALMLTGIGSIYSGSLYFTNRPDLTRNLNIFLGACILLFGIPLTTYYGLIGISFAYIFSGTLFLVSSVLLSKKYIGVSFEKKYLFLSILSATAILPLLYFFRIYYPNLLGIVFSVFLFSFGYFYLLLRLKYFDKKDIELLKIIGRKLPKSIRRKIKFVEEILQKYTEN